MKLIASVLHLDRPAIKALRITDPYSLHRVVYSLFDDVRSDTQKNIGQSSGILYADQGGDFHGRKIILLSDRPPHHNINDFNAEIHSRLISKEFLEYPKYRFKIIINPIRRDNTTSKLTPIKGRDAIAQWFLERAPKNWGFIPSTEHLQIDKIEVLQFKDKAQRSITLAQAHIQGQLIVTDYKQFQHSFTMGIGRGRAFGCGLLQIVPLIDNPFASF